MKKSFLLIPALALLSCGGGNSNQSQNNIDSTTVDTPQCDVSTTDTLTDIQKIWQQIEFTGKDLFDPDLTSGDYIDLHSYGDILYDGSIDLLKSGKSYKVLLNLHSYPQNGDAPMTDPAFSFFIQMFDYKDGKLTEIPLPDELKPFEFKWLASFKDDTLSLSNYYTNESNVRLVWNGTKFVAVSASTIDSSPIPTLITYKWDDGGSEKLGEYCLCDNDGRIIEYGCKLGQYDYDDYIRMCRIYYSGDKVDSIQCKEVYSYEVDEKPEIMGLFANSATSIFDKFTDREHGVLYPTDKDVKDFDPKSIASMRNYSDNIESNLVRSYYPKYEFSFVEKWEKEKRDDQGRLTYSEYTIEDELTNKYKINYTYGDGVVTKKVTINQTGEFEGERVNRTDKYTITERYK
ncbi:MAG: hypothetical protein J6T70_09745 [Bacteroidales bacterium]|nr:hypothetical protein [Bacteroidales bacterium]